MTNDSTPAPAPTSDSTPRLHSSSNLTPEQLKRSREAKKFMEHLFLTPERQVILLPQAEIRNRGKMNQTFTDGMTRLLVKKGSAKSRVWCETLVTRSDEGVEVFYSPSPMSGTNGRKKEQALPNVVVFGDADEGLTPDVHRTLLSLGACLVRSGGQHRTNGPKYHVYLRLTDEASPNEIERLNRGLRHLITGDKYDVTSLLRVPGTRNHKYPKSPLVRVERYADKSHTPAALSKLLPIPEGDTVISGVELVGMRMPLDPPKSWSPRPKPDKPGYMKLRNTVRTWNNRFQFGDPSLRRYMAAIAIVKDCMERGLSIDEAYAFASICEPLIDKQEEENGYTIKKDVARTWYRETKANPPSADGTLTVSKLQAEAGGRKATHEPDADTRSRTRRHHDEDYGFIPNSPSQTHPHHRTPHDEDYGFVPNDPSSSSQPKEEDDDDPSTDNPSTTLQRGSAASLGLDLRNFPFTVPDLNQLLASEYTPLEPTMVPCGTFALLYPGKSHSLVADRNAGKTHIAIAMMHEVLKKGGKVAYWDFEDTPDTFILDRMINQHGIAEDLIKNQFLYLNGYAPEIGDMEIDQAVEYLAEALRGWDLMIIDGVSASMGDVGDDWDDSKSVDYKKWHALMIKPFLDQGLATLQLDHSTKSSPRAGGTMQKGAKLTGVEYQVRVEGPNQFTIGKTGKVILEAAKDRVGRISKHRRTTPPVGHDSNSDWPWNDVATFTLSSDDNARITQAEFQPINYKDSDEHQASLDAPTSDLEFRVIKILGTKTMGKTALRRQLGINGAKASEVLALMVEKGFILETDGPRNTKEVSLTSLVPSMSSSFPSSAHPSEGPGKDLDLDFSRVDVRPGPKGPKRECSRCREFEHLVKPDDIGYRPGQPLCAPCASENIGSDSTPSSHHTTGTSRRATRARVEETTDATDAESTRDGAEWARKKRESIERTKTKRKSS